MVAGHPDSVGEERKLMAFAIGRGNDMELGGFSEARTDEDGALGRMPIDNIRTTIGSVSASGVSQVSRYFGDAVDDEAVWRSDDRFLAINSRRGK